METEEDFLNKVSELMDRTKEDALQSAKALYHSGAIDKEDPEYLNSYILPKLFLVAYASRLKYQWSPPSMTAKRKKTIRNFENFI